MSAVHCSEMEKAIWHSTHAVLPYVWILLLRCQKDSHCSAPTSSIREKLYKTQKHSVWTFIRGHNSCSLPKFRNKALKKSSTSWRSTYKVASALNHTLIWLNPDFPHKQVICETSEVILCVTFTQDKEEKSAQYIPVAY